MKTKIKKLTHDQSGFSLIELMIVLVIAGILVGIAVPGYGRYIERSKRAAAYACLNQISGVMEQVYADSFRYDFDLDQDGDEEFGSDGNCNDTGSDCESLNDIAECVDQVSSSHTIQFDELKAKSFILTADPVVDDYDSQCGTLSLKHTGLAEAAGSLGGECFSQ